jgi:RNA polymerase sigma-70 factor (ECF subfamily)
VRAWFYRILRNAIADYHRGRTRAERQIAALQAQAPNAAEIAGATCKCVGRLKDALEPDYAEAIARVELDGVPVKVFAAERGISASNAAVRLFRAREALRKSVVQTCGSCAESGCLDCSCGYQGFTAPGHH